MNDLRSLIERQIELSAIMPGSIREQYTVCGKPECACGDKINPRKHGPYNQLSFSTKGKSSSMFIKTTDLQAAEEMTATYKEARILTQEIGLAMITLCREVGIKEGKRISEELYEQALRKHLGCKAESSKLKEVDIRGGKWKTKAVERKSEIEKLHVKIRDLTNSRRSWKTKAMRLKEENRQISREAADIKKNFK